MKIKCLVIMALVSIAAIAEQSISLTDDMNLRVGAEIRTRYEGYTNSVPTPNASKNGRHATEYLRTRTRVFGALDFGDDVTINLSLANRFHYVTTSPRKPNNDGASTWEFPDEVIIDAANVVFKNLFDSGISLTIGRQNLFFGNGLLVSEGTPFDQGRTVYVDGLTAKYESDDFKSTLFVLYDRWKDGSVFINDRNRPLRSGNIFTAGLYNTFIINELLNIDLYYMYNDLDDKHPNIAERAYRADSSLSLHTIGMRLFGTVSSLLDYSVEGVTRYYLFNSAYQFGRDADGNHIKADMADIRLKYHIYDDSPLKPMLGVEFTHFSGDDRAAGDNRSWNPIMSQCPLWGEELLPIMLNGMWSNLNMVGTTFSCNPTEKCKVTLYATDYYADERDGFIGADSNTGCGRHVGLLAGLFVSYDFLKDFHFLKSLSGQAYLSHFMPGNYYDNGHDSNWFRLELTAKF